MNNILGTAYKFGYYDQYSGSCLHLFRLLRATQWVPLTMSSVIPNNILGPAYNEFDY